MLFRSAAERADEKGPGKWTATGRSGEELLAGLDRGDTADPNWAGSVGVTGSSAREREKGPGKWTATGRDASELLAGLPPGHSREMDLAATTPRRTMPILLVVVVLLGIAGLAWWLV